MVRSLASKLTLAFLLVGLTGSILVTVIIQQRTRSAFNNFIITQEQQALAENLVYYYQVNGSWVGVDNSLAKLQAFIPMGPGGMRNPFAAGTPLILAGSDRTIIYSNTTDEIGKQVSRSALTGAVTLQSNGKTIGWLLLTPIHRTFSSTSLEGKFLLNVSRATLVSGMVSVLLAISLGGFLAFSMTRSLRDLTDATVEIARGKFGKQVKVRSKDEIGELATSFNQMSLDLEKATHARQQMTADIAHDLRSPLSVITGYAEALSDGKLAGNLEIYNILLQETKHLDHLVDDLRFLTLADTGELSLICQAISPLTLLERLAARHAVVADQHQITLQIEAPKDLPMVNVDAERMAQVLDNLIINSFRYTPEGGKITLAAEYVNDQVLVTVSDTGQGIAPEDLAHVFDRFYRGDKSRPHNGESGLGLAIAKSIVEAHSGKITVDSQPGRGARFTIALSAYKPVSK